MKIDIDKIRLDHRDSAAVRYPVFFKHAWRILEPETKLLWNWHHSLISEYLVAARMGQVTRLIINIAPRTTKSLMTAVCFPAWVWATEPHARFLFGSYADALATKHSVLRRRLIESPWYRWAYPQVKLLDDTNMKTEYSNTATGFMKSAGIKGAVTGEGGDYIIIDDPHNPKGAESVAERSTILQNFDLAWSTRLNDKKTGRIIIIMQRLHENDLTGHLLARNLGYEHVKVPTIAEGNTRVVLPRSNRVIERQDGDLLHPERDGADEIEKAKLELGSYGFAGQHQQAPVPREGAMIKASWLRYYSAEPARFDQLLASWDLSFKGTERSDFVVGTLWGRYQALYYLLDLTRGRWGFPDTLAAFRAFAGKHAHRGVIKHVVEARANGQALIDSLKREIPGIVPYEPKAAKEERLAIVAPLFEAGNILLPSNVPWLNDYVAELTIFPMGANDDQVDSTAQGLLKLSERKTIDWSPVSMTGSSRWAT